MGWRGIDIEIERVAQIEWRGVAKSGEEERREGSQLSTVLSDVIDLQYMEESK